MHNLNLVDIRTQNRTGRCYKLAGPAPGRQSLAEQPEPGRPRPWVSPRRPTAPDTPGTGPRRLPAAARRLRAPSPFPAPPPGAEARRERAATPWPLSRGPSRERRVDGRGGEAGRARAPGAGAPWCRPPLPTGHRRLQPLGAGARGRWPGRTPGPPRPGAHPAAARAFALPSSTNTHEHPRNT